jgi:hypothetical protein
MALAWVRLVKPSNSRLIVYLEVVDMPNWYTQGLYFHTTCKPHIDLSWTITEHVRDPLKLDNDQPVDALNNYDLPTRLLPREGQVCISYVFFLINIFA